MGLLRTNLDTSSEQFRCNRDDMLDQLAELDKLHDEAAAGGGERAMDRLRSRGKLPVRERISAVLDPDSPFYEISSLAAYCWSDGASDKAVGAVCTCTKNSNVLPAPHWEVTLISPPISSTSC